MKIFVAPSYSTKVDYTTGEVFPEHKAWVESILSTIEDAGYEVFCALRADGYRINNADPAEAYFLDTNNIKSSDIFLALVGDEVSPGIQIEIGYAIALDKKVILAHDKDHQLAYFNNAIVRAKVASELVLPLTVDKLIQSLK